MDTRSPAAPRPGGVRLTAFGLVMTVALLAAAPASSAAASRLGPSSTVSARLLPPAPRRIEGVPRPPVVPLRTLDPADLAAGKRAAAQAGAFRAPLAPPGLGPQPGPASAISTGLNDPGLSATDNTSQSTPPDATGAIGPSSYIQFVNTRVGLFSRSTLARMSDVDLATFAGQPGGDVFDPQIQYDPVSGRWYYLAAQCTNSRCNNNNYLVFGWSNGASAANPSLAAGDWCRYQLPTGGLLDDYPKLGHSDGYVVFGSNVFQGNSFKTARVWAVPKPTSNVCPASPTATSFGSTNTPLRTSDNTLAFTPVPADTFDASANAYVAAADYPGSASASQIMTWHVAPGAPPTLVADGNTDVPSYSFPANVPQPGTSGMLDSMDTRLTQAVGVGGAVWTQHTVAGTGGRSQVRWYKVTPGAAAPAESGTLASGSDFVFNAAVSPTADGSSAAIGYNVGSASRLAEVRAQVRTGAGTMGNEVTLAASGGVDSDYSCPSPCRWGDYSAATPDPNSNSVVWGTNQLNGLPAGTNARWITRNFALDTSAAPIAAPTATTGSATSISSSAATLQATINPNGQSTTYRFDYGTTTGYGSQVLGGGPISGSTDQSVSLGVSGLAPGTTYHFRVVAESAGGVTAGADQTFATSSTPPPPPPPSVTTGTATNVTDTAATLNGTVNPNGQSTTYFFQYGTTTGYGSSTAPTAAGSGTANGAVSANVASLTPGMTYHFRLVAQSAGGTTNGSDAVFTTTGGGGGGGGGGTGGGGIITTTTTTTASPTIIVTPLPAPAPTPVKIAARTVRATSGGSVYVRVACPSGDAGGCAGTLTLRTVKRYDTSARAAALRRVTLGKGSFRLAAGRSAAVRVRLTRTAMRLLRRLRSLRVRGYAVATVRTTTVRTTSPAFTLRAPLRR